jgi:hypothetical protein
MRAAYPRAAGEAPRLLAAECNVWTFGSYDPWAAH